jgi:hypothetical protein
MIDTIVLTFDEGQYVVTRPNNFEPSLNLLSTQRGWLSGRAYMKFKNNPTKEDYVRGIYRPRLTITARFKDKKLQNMLKVEFSAPKMIYGNNLQELTESDLPELINRVQKSLENAGVFITGHGILNANVSAIHYSKNFVFRDGTLPSMLLREIHKCNVTLRLDSNNVDYRNEGHALKFRSNSYEIVFYDKIRDLEQSRISPKRTEEKDDNLLQMGLFDQIQQKRSTIKKPYEVLRYEVRLNQRKKIKHVFEQLFLDDTETTLEGLFKQTIAQSVLRYYLRQLANNYPTARTKNTKMDDALLAQLVVQNPDLKIVHVFAWLGWKAMLKTHSMREIKRLIGSKNARSWSRLRKIFGSIKMDHGVDPLFQVLDEQLSKFQSVKGIEVESILSNTLQVNSIPQNMAT